MSSLHTLLNTNHRLSSRRKPQNGRQKTNYPTSANPRPTHKRRRNQYPASIPHLPSPTYPTAAPARNHRRVQNCDQGGWLCGFHHTRNPDGRVECYAGQTQHDEETIFSQLWSPPKAKPAQASQPASPGPSPERHGVAVSNHALLRN